MLTMASFEVDQAVQLLRYLIETWSDKAFVGRSSEGQKLGVTASMMMLMSMLDSEALDRAFSRERFFNGVQHWLQLSDDSKRALGMIAAEFMSRLFDSKAGRPVLSFGIDFITAVQPSWKPDIALLLSISDCAKRDAAYKAAKEGDSAMPANDELNAHVPTESKSAPTPRPPRHVDPCFPMTKPVDITDATSNAYKEYTMTRKLIKKSIISELVNGFENDAESVASDDSLEPLPADQSLTDAVHVGRYARRDLITEHHVKKPG